LCLKREGKRLPPRIRSIFDSPDLYFANMRVRELVEKYKDIHPEFSQKLEEVEETFSCFHFSSSHRKRIRTTNSLERFNAPQQSCGALNQRSSSSYSALC